MTGEGKCRWRFRELQPFDKLQGANDPIISKFKENFFNSLVRESIQNSMDAKSKEKTHIEVKYDLSKISKRDFPNLFALKKHIQACKDTHADNNRACELYGPMAEFLDCEELDILTISDYNTCGMPYVPGDIYKNPFQAFINSDGQSVKNTRNSDGSPVSNGGSFGIGKGAYFLMSPVRSLLVSTMTEDGSTFFEGVSRLCTHDLNGRHYYNMGFYCANDTQAPVIGDEIPNAFKRHEAGTTISLVGKYHDLGNKKNIEYEIEKAVVTNFWLAIHNNKLIVTVGQREPITKNTLESKMLEIFKGEHYKKVNPYLFYKAYITPEDNVKFFKFHMHDPELLGHCELHVTLGDAGKNDRITYMRDLNMLIQTKPNPKPRHAGISAIFLCLGSPGNENLELTEDESHTSWSSCGKSGEAKQKANILIKKIENFIIDSIDSILGKDNEKYDITIDSITPTDEQMRQIESKDGESGNPFGVVRDEKNGIENGFERTSSLNDLGEANQDKSLTCGKIISKTENGGGQGDNTVPTGGGVTRKRGVENKNKEKKGRCKKNIDFFDDTEQERRFVPAYFDVAAHIVDAQWVHTILIEVDDEDKTSGSVYVDIAVGSESGDDINANIKKAQMGSISLRVHGSRVYFNDLNSDEVIFDVIFDDNIRHAIRIG